MDAIRNADQLIVQELDQRNVFDLDQLRPGQRLELDFYPDEIIGKKDKPLHLVVEAGDSDSMRILYSNNKWKPHMPINIHGSRMVREANFLTPGKIVESWYLEVAIFNEELAKQQRRGEKPIITPLGELNPKEVLELCKDEEERMRALASFEDLYGWERLVLPKLASWKINEKT